MNKDDFVYFPYENYCVAPYTEDEVIRALERNIKKPPELNCPNCGAPVVDSQCAYCGTIFYTDPDRSNRKSIKSLDLYNSSKRLEEMYDSAIERLTAFSMKGYLTANDVRDINELLAITK